MNRHQDKETDWLAFQYVADELSEAQRADFESRLEWDEAAQRSLGSMVELTLAIAAAEPSAVGSGAERVAAMNQPGQPPRRNTGRRPNRKIVWLAGCLAASAIVLIAAWVAMQSRWLSSQVATMQVAGDDWQRLAVIWNETRSEWPADEAWPADADTRMASSAPSPADENTDEWPVSETPPWIWAGVTGAEQADGDDPTADSGEI